MQNRYISRVLTCGTVLVLAAAASAQVVEGWKTGTVGEPQGAPNPRTNQPLGVTLTPVLMNGTAPVSPQNGDCFLYLLNQGTSTDSDGSTSRFDVEGINYGNFRSQGVVQWNGLLNRLKPALDTALGNDAWTIKRIWLGVDPATGIPLGCNPGLVSVAETNFFGLPVGTIFADWGNQTAAPTEAGGNVVTLLPAGYHGHQMGPTRFSTTPPCVQTEQQVWEPDSYLLMDESMGSPQPYPSGSLSFQKLVSGPNTRVRPVADTFTAYFAPINDATTGAATAVSYDGFNPGNFGFSPYLLFEVCKQPVLVGPTPPVPSNPYFNVPFSAVAGTNCAGLTVTATDADIADTLSITITNPGTIGGTIAPANGTMTNNGGGNYSFSFTYNVPANVRGIDEFDYSVSDGTNTAFGKLRFVIRGAAARNTVAFGANSGSDTRTMQLYTGAAVPNGGTNGVRDILAGEAFAQSTEYDNWAGIRHNYQGNLLSLNFGTLTAGGSLRVYATKADCNGKMSYTFFNFDAATVGMATRVCGLSVSPSNNRIAVLGLDSTKLYVLNYTQPGGAGAVGRGGNTSAAATLALTVDCAAIMSGTRTIGTTWFNNDNVMIVDVLGNVHMVDVTAPVPPSPFAPFIACPRFIGAVSVADIEYNPEISPNVYVTVGEFSGGITTNTLWVGDPATQSVVLLNGGASLFADYSGSGADTFRECGFDCYGNLFLGSIVDLGRFINLRYVRNAADAAGITGGVSSLRTWRTITTEETASNFSGMDVAAATTIGAGLSPCPNPPPETANKDGRTSLNTQCVFSLSASDLDLAQTLTFSIGNPGSAGGSLTAVGGVSQVGDVRTQSYRYTPVPGFRGVECFNYSVNDGSQNSNVSTFCVDVRASVQHDTVAFGAGLSDVNQTLRLYYGAHVANGGTNGAEDVVTGLSFPQSVEFDNFNNKGHNPVGNLLTLNYGTTAGGGALQVFPSISVCGGQPGLTLYSWNGAGAPLTRVTGLSVSPDNLRVAAYGVDSRNIHVLDYTTGPGVGLGGPTAVTSVFANIDLLTNAALTTPRTHGTAWLNNSSVLWVDETGHLWEFTLAGTSVQRMTNPRPAVNISSADVEYNPAISPNVYVFVGEFDSVSSTTTNTLYIVNPATWTIVTQAGGASFTDHSTAPTGTVREIAFDSVGNLFLSTFVSSTDRVNVRFIPGASSAASIAANSSVIYNSMDVGQFLPANGFSGLDIATAVVCSLPGDMNGDGRRNGLDVEAFVRCFLSGPSIGAGCACADMDNGGTIVAGDQAAFIAAMLAP